MQEDSSKESGGRKGDKNRKAHAAHEFDVPDRLEDAQVASSSARGPRFAKPVSVSFSNKDAPNTPDEALWDEILDRSDRLSFANYAAFIDSVLCEPENGFENTALLTDGDGHASTASYAVKPYRRDLAEKLQAGLRSHLFGPDAYLLLQVATESFLMHHACASPSDELLASKYLTGANGTLLPYFALIKQRLAGRVGTPGTMHLGSECASVSASRILEPCFVELIWSYWHEQGMLVQAINAIAIRYQNIRQGRGRDPLAGFELDPLRPLNNILWGYLQEEHRRLSLVRRAYEYDHHYGLRLSGRAIPPLRPADSRSKFLPAFHELLHQAHGFYKDDDVATVQADAFPILNSLRELHFVLTEGMHNQFGDLPSQSRVEMLMQQYLLSRTEIREFLRGRQMVPYPELWMDSVDTMKTLQGWTDVPVMYFNELAVTGEQLLISVRYANWSQQTITSIDSAANWARRFRPVVQRYLYAYRMVTGVDLSVDRVEVQSAQTRDGQPPIRMRVGRQQRAMPRMRGGDDFDLLAPPAPRALPAGIDDVTLSPRPFTRRRG
jgi:hypothetical protein